MQIDIGFGDAVYPEPELASFPVLLPMEAPLIRAYPRESAIAEKFHAMVVLDIRNSRMKDFYDVWLMASTWIFDMASLRSAILASFERRRFKDSNRSSVCPNGRISKRSPEKEAMGRIRKPTKLGKPRPLSSRSGQPPS
jgi:predicted nucleotidyltransferase component of viral defense system